MDNSRSMALSPETDLGEAYQSQPSVGMYKGTLSGERLVFVSRFHFFPPFIHFDCMKHTNTLNLKNSRQITHTTKKVRVPEHGSFEKVVTIQQTIFTWISSTWGRR
jgi:hypothetical protein